MGSKTPWCVVKNMGSGFKSWLYSVQAVNFLVRALVSSRVKCAGDIDTSGG